jgi:glutamyl-tRNA reductase
VAVIVVGLNHRSVPLELLERMTVPAEQLPKALHDLVTRDNVTETVLLSTCNRTEIYVVAERYHGALQDVRSSLSELAHLPPEEFADHLYAFHDDAAVAHLFSVASGLDSAVLGESEILGQVRQAWELAQAEGASRTTLNLMFRHAVTVGKRARTETGIGRGTASVSHAAVEMATEHLGGLAGRNVLVVGAGAMGEGIAVALRAAGVAQILVANRTRARGADLAARVGGTAVGFDEVGTALRDADLVLTSTGADLPVLTVGLVTAMRAPGRPLLVVDVAVPRDVEPAVRELDGVTVLDLDDLRDWADRGRAARAHEADRVRLLVRDEVERFTLEHTALQAAPLIASMHERAEAVRAGELERFAAKLAALDLAQRDVVEALTRSIVAKLLHEPSVRLKQQAGSPQGARNAAAVADLFDLG